MPLMPQTQKKPNTEVKQSINLLTINFVIIRVLLSQPHPSFPSALIAAHTHTHIMKMHQLIFRS